MVNRSVYSILPYRHHQRIKTQLVLWGRFIRGYLVDFYQLSTTVVDHVNERSPFKAFLALISSLNAPNERLDHTGLLRKTYELSH